MPVVSLVVPRSSLEQNIASRSLTLAAMYAYRRRHEANHNAHPAFQCKVAGCGKPFQRPDLLSRHMERQ